MCKYTPPPPYFLYALSRLLKETRWVSLGGDKDDDLVAGSNHNPAVIYHRPLLNPLLHPLSRLLEETRWVRLESERNPMNQFRR